MKDIEALVAEVKRLTAERDEARYNARLLAFAYEHDVTPGLVFNRAVAASLAYPVKP